MKANVYLQPHREISKLIAQQQVTNNSNSGGRKLFDHQGWVQNQPSSRKENDRYHTSCVRYRHNIPPICHTRFLIVSIDSFCVILLFCHFVLHFYLFFSVFVPSPGDQIYTCFRVVPLEVLILLIVPSGADLHND